MGNQDTEQYRKFLNNLQIAEQRPAALNDIKNLLIYKPPGEALTTIRDFGISKIVQCLNEPSDEAQVSLTCDVLKICFEKFDVGDVVKNYTAHFMYLLRHTRTCVRKLAIEEVHKIVTADPALLPVPQYVDVFVAVAQLVSDPELGIANKAVLITSNLPFEAYPRVLEEMKIALEYGSSSKCNAFEVVINVSSKSFELLQLCAENGYMESIISELNSHDILYQMNILELLSRLAIKPHGINYLVQHGALNSIAQLITQMKDDPMAALLTPGYMKFFGSVAHYYPKEIFEKYSVLLNLLFDTFESGDPNVLPVALETLGFIGDTIEGKLCLAAVGCKYTQTVEKVGQLIRNSVTEIKSRALYCFASLISVSKDPKTPKIGPIDNRVTLMTREWFRSMSTQPPPMEVVIECVKNPFPDINIAALALLDAVCQHLWGVELVATSAGFIEYILDRTIDSTKESKEAKYEIIKKLSHSTVFDSNTLERLQAYVELGPFHSETSMQVAVEEGD